MEGQASAGLMRFPAQTVEFVLEEEDSEDPDIDIIIAMLEALESQLQVTE